MNRDPPSPRRRFVLFIALMLVGLAYIGVFVWFRLHSVDFIERDRDMRAALAASANPSSTFTWTFEAGSRALAMLGNGWRLPDAEAVWSEREGGVVYLPASVVSASELEVRLDGHLNPLDQEMWVILIANGATIGRWRLTHQYWQIVDRVTLPARVSAAVPWRIQFAIERPKVPLWRGYKPELLAYGIHLRGLRSIDAADRERTPAE